MNPNQPGCGFPSKNLAGVGVMFYVMLALRAELRRRGAFTPTHPSPNLAALLDLVALGTVADVVPLDTNNRILVTQGLARIRAGGMRRASRRCSASPGAIARRAPRTTWASRSGPRLNAAGRLDDMSLGIECLLADDAGSALRHRRSSLDQLNRERREIEARDAGLRAGDARDIEAARRIHA